jgi:DNA-binding HxlR family transcriptional regulator
MVLSLIFIDFPFKPTLRRVADLQKKALSRAILTGRKPALDTTSAVKDDAKSAVEPDAEQQEHMHAMVRDLMEKVADRWTLEVLEALEEHGRVRFTQLSRILDGVSQKMLTKTLRQMECDGLVKRVVHPVVPPHVDYELTSLGLSLGEAFCPLWHWVQAHYAEVQQAREAFARQHAGNDWQVPRDASLA